MNKLVPILTWYPKSVQSAKAVFDPSGNSDYEAAYNAYAIKWDAYSSASGVTQLWSGSVLDPSPEKGQFGSSGRDMNVDGSFNVESVHSWICCEEQNMEELKNLMTTNGINVEYTSSALGAFSVTAESVEQLATVVHDNTLIRDIKPIQLIIIGDIWGSQ